MDELEDLHADRENMFFFFTTMEAEGEGWFL